MNAEEARKGIAARIRDLLHFFALSFVASNFAHFLLLTVCVTLCNALIIFQPTKTALLEEKS